MGCPAAWYEIVVDCGDPWAQATWWADLLGARPGREAGRPWAFVADVPGFPYEYLVFHPVPEGKFREPRTGTSALTCTNGELICKTGPMT